MYVLLKVAVIRENCLSFVFKRYGICYVGVLFWDVLT